MVEMTCEKCGSLYELTEDEFERYEEQKTDNLCPVCFDRMLYMQVESEKPPIRCFEYKVIVLTINDKINFNNLGQDGWELVTVNNSEAYFKREYFKEENSFSDKQ